MKLPLQKSFLFLILILVCVILGYLKLNSIYQDNQEKFKIIENRLDELGNWFADTNSLEVFHIDQNEDVFTFEHIDGEGGVGWTRIMQNGEIEDSLGFYTNYIDPILTPLSAETLIGSAWQWPFDSKLYNGPFYNYYLDFETRKELELSTRGRLIAKSSDGRKVVFIESACDKEYISKPSADCNNLDLSLRLIDLDGDLAGVMINHYYAMNQWTDKSLVYPKFLDFGRVAFSLDNRRLAIEVKIEEIDYDTPKEYWTLFIADTESGEIIKRNNRLVLNRYRGVYWLDNESVLSW
jgi:hypothetical protein